MAYQAGCTVVVLLVLSCAGCASLPTRGPAPRASGEITCRQAGTPRQRCGTPAQWQRYDALIARERGRFESAEGFSSDHIMPVSEQAALGTPWPPSQCCMP